MLVLSRFTDEAITIGDDIRIRIVGVRGGRVRIGVEAPRSVAVHREEVYEAIQAAPKKRNTKGSGANDLIG